MSGRVIEPVNRYPLHLITPDLSGRVIEPVNRYPLHLITLS